MSIILSFEIACIQCAEAPTAERLRAPVHTVSGMCMCAVDGDEFQLGRDNSDHDGHLLDG